MRDTLRKRFRDEYTSLLVSRKEKSGRSIEVGEIVLMATDNTKRLFWPLAKVTEIIAGKDGHSRLARVKNKKGEYVRPLQRLFPLEVRSHEIDSYKKSDLIEPEKLAEPEIQKELRTKSRRVIKKRNVLDL